MLYIGKLKVWNKKVPESFIDDALDKFKLHELEKTKNKAAAAAHTDEVEEELLLLKNSQSTNSLHQQQSEEMESKVVVVNKSVSLQNISTSTEQDQTTMKGKKSSVLPVEIDEHNRTMVLQVDRTDLRLISPDRKVVLMHKHHREVCTCVQGMKNAEHFGFVCRESNTNSNQTTTTTSIVYVGYVFKCESASVATDAVQAITQAFANAESHRHLHRNTITSCEHCPMVWYHKLCCEVEHLSDRKTQAAIFRRYIKKNNV